MVVIFAMRRLKLKLLTMMLALVWITTVCVCLTHSFIWRALSHGSLAFKLTTICAGTRGAILPDQCNLRPAAERAITRNMKRPPSLARITIESFTQGPPSLDNMLSAVFKFQNHFHCTAFAI